MSDLPQIVQGVLQYFIVPLWILAGTADWACHRYTGIQHNAGTKESVLHLIMLAQIGVPVFAVLFLEVNALVIALIIVAFVAHQLTALFDLRYTTNRRFISPLEQQVHSFLELMPLVAGLLIIILHWPQFLSLFGLGDEAPDLSLRAKLQPLSSAYVISVLCAVVLLDLGPCLEEFWRCRRSESNLNSTRERQRTWYRRT
jgi:hypothetical protein